MDAFAEKRLVEVAFVANRFEVDATESDRLPPENAPKTVRLPVTVPPESGRYESDGMSDALRPETPETVMLERLVMFCAAAKGAA